MLISFIECKIGKLFVGNAASNNSFSFKVIFFYTFLLKNLPFPLHKHDIQDKIWKWSNYHKLITIPGLPGVFNTIIDTYTYTYLQMSPDIRKASSI